METMKATNLRKNLYTVLDQVSHGELIEIVLGGKTVATLAPAPGVCHSKRKPLIDLDRIARFCKKYELKSFALFGSILRDDFHAKSDVDVMVDVGDRDCLDLHTECQMMEELEAMFGRKVDIFPTYLLPQLNQYRRESISSTAKVIYDVAIS